jgi:hypothetical protein
MIRASVLRVLKIWSERAVYPSSSIHFWEKKLPTSSAVTSLPVTSYASCQKESTATTKIVAEFRLPKVLEFIDRMKVLERESASKRESIDEKSFNILTVDINSHLKDKRMGEVLLKQSEGDTKVLKELITSLENETAHRSQLIEELTKALVFYVVQNSEVDQVFKAYIKVGKNVAKVLKRMTEDKPRLEVPTDAPSPTNSDEGPILPSDRELSTKTIDLDRRLEVLFNASNVTGIPIPSNGSSDPSKQQESCIPGLDGVHSYSPSNMHSGNGMTNSVSPSFLQPIRSVISARESHPAFQENLEPSDMDLGNSDDEDSYASASTSSHIPYPRSSSHQPTQEYNPHFPSYEAPIRSHPLPPQSQLYQAIRDQRPTSYNRHPISPPPPPPLSHSHSTQPPPNRRSSPEPYVPRRGRHSDWEPRNNSHALGRPRQGYKHGYDSESRNGVRRGSSSSGSGSYHRH